MINTQNYSNMTYNNETDPSSKLINGILGENEITYGELNLALQEFRPHYTNCKYNSDFKSKFNDKFKKRYEQLSFLSKAARYDSSKNKRFIQMNVILLLLVKLSEKMNLFSFEISSIYNVLSFALIGFFLYKAAMVRQSIKTLSEANIEASGSISLGHVLIVMLNLLMVLPMLPYSNLHTVQIYETLPLLIGLFLLVIHLNKAKYHMPEITADEKMDEKALAAERNNKVMNQVSQSSRLKGATLTSSTKKVISLNDYRLENKEVIKYLNRRKNRL